MARLPESYNTNGIPFPWTGVLNHDKHVVARESSSRPNFHEDKATIAKDRNGAGFLRTPNQPTPQTFSKAEPLSLGMNNGIDTTETRNSGMVNSSIEVAKTVSTNAPTTNTEYKFQWKKISRSARKRYHKLKEEGIPMEEARKLCRMDRSTLEHMLLLSPQKRNHSEAPQGPPNKTPKMSIEIDMQNSLNSNDKGPLRVGITNSQNMSKDQMRMLHQYLITVIMERCSDGCGPEFLGFSHKAGWVLVTCCNQRSKDWLVHEVPHLEPWPGAQLSIIPDQELPKPPRAVTLIPDSHGVSVDGALKLFKEQNSGLYTELWKVRFEKVEKEGKTVYFTIDDASADALRAQNCQASIGSEKVTFKINGQYRPYTPRTLQNQVPATQGRSSKPISESLNRKSSDQSKEATVTNKVGPSLAPRCQLPQAACRDQVQPIQHQDSQTPAKKITFAQGCGEITSWKKPAALAKRQSMSQTRGETRPITQNSQGHGKTPLIQPNLGGAVNRESSASARGRAPQATNRAAQQINQDSQNHGKTLLIQPSQGRPVIRESSFSAKGLAPQATSRSAQQINQESQGHGKTPLIQPRLGRPVIRGSSITAKGLPPQAPSRSAQRINQEAQGHGKTPLIQPRLGRPVIRESSITAKGLPPQAPTKAAIQNNTNTRHIIQDSQSGRTPTKGRFGSAGETVFGVKGSVLANRGSSSQRVSFDHNMTNGTIHLDKSSRATTGGTYQAKNAFSSHMGAFALNKSVPVRELTPGGFGARPIIQNPLSRRTPFTQSREDLTEALARRKISQVSDPPSVGRKLVQDGMEAATASNQDGFLGQSQARNWFGGRPIIRDSQFRRPMSQNRIGETDRTSNQGSALTTNQVPRSQETQGHGKIPLIQPSQERPVIRESSITAEGLPPQATTRAAIQNNRNTRHFIQDSQSGRTPTMGRFGSAGETVFGVKGSVLAIQDTSHGNQAFDQGWKFTKIYLTATDSDEALSRDMSPEAGGGYHSWVIEDLESYTSRLTQGNSGTGTSKSATEMTSVSKLSPQGTDSYGARIIGSESYGRPVYGCRITTGQSRQERLLSHPSGRGSFELRTIEPECHVRPFHGSRTVTGRDSRPDKGLLSHPSGSGSFELRIIEPECHVRPFNGSRTVTGRDSRPDKGLLPHPSGSFRSGTIELENHGRPVYGSRTINGQSRPDKGLLPPFESRTFEPERHGMPLQDSRAMVTDRRAMSSRRLSPQGRGSSGGRIQDTGPHGKLQGSKGTLTDQDSRSDRRLSPLARGSYGGRQDPEPHGRFQGKKGSLTDRDSRTDRRLSPHARDSYGGRQDRDTHVRPFRGSKRSLTDRDSRSDSISPHAKGYSAWTIEEPQSYGRGMSWDGSTARPRARMN